jgi:histidine phosphotransfer protein HptB
MIDWDKVQDLRDEVGADDFAEVVAIFIDEVEQVTTRLAVASEAAELERDLHFLKGAALNLGFSRLAGLCEAGERLAAAGRVQDVDVAAVLDVYAASRMDFLSGIAAGQTG